MDVLFIEPTGLRSNFFYDRQKLMIPSNTWSLEDNGMFYNLLLGSEFHPLVYWQGLHSTRDALK